MLSHPRAAAPPAITSDHSMGSLGTQTKRFDEHSDSKAKQAEEIGMGGMGLASTLQDVTSRVQPATEGTSSPYLP